MSYQCDPKMTYTNTYDSRNTLDRGPGLSTTIESLVHVQGGQAECSVTLHLYCKTLLQHVAHTLETHTITV